MKFVWPLVACMAVIIASGFLKGAGVGYGALFSFPQTLSNFIVTLSTFYAFTHVSVTIIALLAKKRGLHRE